MFLVVCLGEGRSRAIILFGELFFLIDGLMISRIKSHMVNLGDQ